MAQERTRSLGRVQGESDDSLGTDPAQRTYREEEVVRILQRAARLEQTEAVPSTTLSLDEIESIARESGIDPSRVRQAAGELEPDPGRGWGTLLAGAPVHRVVERVVEGEIGTEHHEALVMVIRSLLATGAAGMSTGPGWGMHPVVTAVGRSLIVTGWARGSILEAQVGPRKGKTFIRIESSSGPLAGGLFGGIMGGMGGGLGSNVGWMIPTFLHWPVAAGLAGAAAVVLGAYGLARSIFSGRVRSLHRRMDQLADSLAGEVRELVR